MGPVSHPKLSIINGQDRFDKMILQSTIWKKNEGRVTKNSLKTIILVTLVRTVIHIYEPEYKAQRLTHLTECSV